MGEAVTQKISLAAICDAGKALPDDSVIITDQTVADLWGGRFQPLFALSVPPGEESKNWAVTGSLLEQLAEHGVKRSTTLAALGGGVVGDLGGFAASVLLRGLPFIQVPTTLLAMVDSSIGGKVGVDLAAGKNLAGSFWPAQEIIICPEFLATLPEREWQCGAAEVWKYGAIMDSALWDSLLAEPLHPGRSGMEEVILTCATHKQQIVQEDPYERTGLRAILNFGHTVGHAIEWAAGYGAMTHGEAIAIGMVVEARLGELLGASKKGVRDAVYQGMERQGLPTQVPDGLSPEVLLKAMARDKKADSSGLAFSLLGSLGECKLYKGVPPDAVKEALEGQ